MDGTAVKTIEELSTKNQLIEKDGMTFARGDFRPIQYVPRPCGLVGKTLTGLIQYITENPEDINMETCFLKVVDYSKVELLQKFDGPDFKRTLFYSAEVDQYLPVFEFGKFMSIEEFLIKARALFQPTADLETVVSIASRVTEQKSIEAKDNGISQEVSLKKGVSGALSENVTTKGVYNLKPYRTFRDVEQVESQFILRLKAVEGELPKVALFDAGGEIWRHLAALTIAEWIQEKLLEFLEKNPAYVPMLPIIV